MMDYDILRSSKCVTARDADDEILYNLIVEGLHFDMRNKVYEHLIGGDVKTIEIRKPYTVKFEENDTVYVIITLEVWFYDVPRKKATTV